MNYLHKLNLFEEIYRKNNELESFVISYLDNTKVQQKHNFDKLNNHEVLEQKNRTGVSFWQSALSMNHEIILGDEYLISAITYHNGPGVDRLEICASDIYQKLKNIIEAKETSQSINIISRVNIKNNDFGYLPIIDFRVKQSKNNFNSALKICQIIGKKMQFKLHLFESKSSYHAYGEKILNHDEYFSFLGWAMLFDPVVDGRHIAHQLIDGYGALNIA